jgi:Cof subfamily protein (haloacid dehalogenase superfamily)
MTVRLIASDLDGTLFGVDHVPEPRTVAAVNAVVEAGMMFVAVTGRSHFGGADRVRSTGARPHWFIGSNGGHRLNFASGVLEERLVFDADLLPAVLRDLASALDGIGFGLEHAGGFTWDDNFCAVYPESLDGAPRRDSAPRTIDDVGKFFVAHRDAAAAELITALGPLLPTGFHVTTSGTAFVEVTPAGADKGAGLARLCALLEIGPGEVIAFGDNHNDLTMLEWAGRGIAMANAVPEVVAIADEVTASNVDFGVAAVLETLI